MQDYRYGPSAPPTFNRPAFARVIQRAWRGRNRTSIRRIRAAKMKLRWLKRQRKLRAFTTKVRRRRAASRIQYRYRLMQAKRNWNSRF